MTISYPLSVPASPTVSEVRWIQEQSMVVDESPFSFAKQVQVFSGERWRIEVSIDAMERADAAAWSAFLASLRGPFGTFLFGDELYKTPRGLAGGTPRVNGGSQSGYTLVTDGWTNGASALKAGDFFQISGTNYIHQVLNDATADGSGNATLDIWPRARSYTDNTQLVTSNWKGLFSLEENSVEIFSPRYERLQTVSFNAVEVR